MLLVELIQSTTTLRRINYQLLEELQNCGTSPDSLIGSVRDKQCDVVRLVLEDDVTSDFALNKALSAVSDKRYKTLLRASIPCTGGSSWQNVNLKRCGPQTRFKIMAHRRACVKLGKSFEIVAAQCIENGGSVAIEWSTSCLCWSYRQVKRFVNMYALQKARFDGCMYGMKSERRVFMGRLLRSLGQ